jgi:hypothetical protein
MNDVGYNINILRHPGTIQPQEANNMTPTCKIEHHNNQGPRILFF